jgi:putative intracellular protease/amidase
MRNPSTVRALLIVEDGYGANWLIKDGRPSIQARLESFGWEVETASPSGLVRPCPWAASRGLGPVRTDHLTAALGDPAAWDAVLVLPGCSCAALAADEAALAFLRKADGAGLTVAAFCRGARVLAAAGILRGRRAAGHMDHAAEFRAAGAFHVGYRDLGGKSDAPLPVIDGNIVTGMRSNLNRLETCDAIRRVTEARLSALAPEGANRTDHARGRT